MKYKKLVKRVKQYILNNGGEEYCSSLGSLDSNINYENTFRKYHTLAITKNIEEDTKKYKWTIGGIKLLISADYDYLIDTDEVIKRQISLVLLSDWEEDRSYEKAKEYHYFINSVEDFDFDKIKNYYNNLLDKLRFNNFHMIEKELKFFIDTVLENEIEEDREDIYNMTILGKDAYSTVGDNKSYEDYYYNEDTKSYQLIKEPLEKYKNTKTFRRYKNFIPNNPIEDYNEEYNIMLSSRFINNEFKGLLLDSSMSEEEVNNILNYLLSLK